MKKVKELVNNSKVKVATLATTAMLVPTLAFAEGEADVSTSLVTALTSTKGEVIKTMGAVAVVALGIFGFKFAWKHGIKFFSSLASK